MQPQSLDQFADRLLIQCRLSQADVVADVARAHNAGIVLTGTSPDDVVDRLRARGFDGPILCDASRYSGARRVSGRCGIRPAWCRRQHDLGLTALTDSGYLGARDWIGLRMILRAAERQSPPVVAMLPLAARWFATPSLCEALSHEIDKYGVPVGVAIEHSGDPFGAQYLLRGFLQLLQTVAVPVLLLRSDVSALGALCHGVHAAAIGTVSALRHFYPVKPNGKPPVPGVSAFVTPLLSYHRTVTCARVFAKTADMSHLWVCDCPRCDGATPSWLNETSDLEDAAFQHSLHAQLGLWAEIFGSARTRDELVSTWHETCSHALYVHQQVAEVIDRWRTPSSLRSWYRVTDDPLPHRTRIPRQAGQRAARIPRPQLSE
ncbi:hypothetical protein [Kibdelosporangium aridum]|uniref:hypothetical protein n=1 Tax=Kibdelosporangium aridum TaxID=2030 RepID=UPI0035ECB274